MTDLEIIQQRQLAELRQEVDRLSRELSETREEIVTVGAKMLPLIKLTGIEAMMNNKSKMSMLRIIQGIGMNLVRNWEHINYLIHKDINFFAQIINLFTLKYAEDVKKRTNQEVMKMMSISGPSEKLKALKNVNP